MFSFVGLLFGICLGGLLLPERYQPPHLEEYALGLCLLLLALARL
jgi:hypothetical protein